MHRCLVPVVFLLAGCDPLVTAEVQLTVSEDVVAQYDADSPGAVHVWSEGELWFSQPVAVLCDPAAGALTVDLEEQEIGCASEGLEVHAWVAPVEEALVEGLCDLPEAERLQRITDAGFEAEPRESWPQSVGVLDFGEIPSGDRCISGQGSLSLAIE